MSNFKPIPKEKLKRMRQLKRTIGVSHKDYARFLTSEINRLIDAYKALMAEYEKLEILVADRVNRHPYECECTVCIEWRELDPPRLPPEGTKACIDNEIVKEAIKKENEIMSAEKLFCQIDVPDPETASYLVTLLTCAYPGNTEVDLTTSDRIKKFFPGGFEAVEKMGLGLNKKRYKILRGLEVKLNSLGIWTGSNSPAPWVEVGAPTNIKGVPIEYLGKKGIKIGPDVTLSLEEMKAAVKKCEGD